MPLLKSEDHSTMINTIPWIFHLTLFSTYIPKHNFSKAAVELVIPFLLLRRQAIHYHVVSFDCTAIGMSKTSQISRGSLGQNGCPASAAYLAFLYFWY